MLVNENQFVSEVMLSSKMIFYCGCKKINSAWPG